MLNLFSNPFSQEPPPYHVNQHGVPTIIQHLETESITGHHSIRSRDGVIVVMYETHWTRLSRPPWE